MSDYNILGNKVRQKLLTYARKLSQDFTKPKQRFIADMLTGTLSSNSSKLTDIGRELKEDIELKKTVERLGRNLCEFSQGKELMQNYLSTMKQVIGADTMLLVDGGDVTKACSPKMECIGSVKDGSTGKFADGYWTMGAVALSDKCRQPIPVYEELYPCKKQGGAGHSAETLKCLQHLRENFANDIVRLFDRGFDSGAIITDLVKQDEKFILRSNQNRVVIHKGKQTYINDVVRGLVCENELVFESKSGNKNTCKIGMTQILLPNIGNIRLNLVVCKQFGDKPLVLLTNLSEELEEIALRVVKVYLMRWRIEEFYGFKKQGLNFEDFRVRSLNSIKNLDLFLTIAVGFIGMLSDNKDTMLVMELISTSKRIPKFHKFMKHTKFFFYAVLDGMTRVLASLKYGISRFFLPQHKPLQLSLPFC